MNISQKKVFRIYGKLKIYPYFQFILKLWVLYSYMRWMEEYKNFLLDIIIQILYCLRSHFHPEKEQEGELFPCCQRKMAGNTFKKLRCKFIMKFWKLALSMSSMRYVLGKFNNRLTVSSHFVLADNFSLTMRKFCLLARPNDEIEIRNKAYCIIYIRMFESLLNYSIHL